MSDSIDLRRFSDRSFYSAHFMDLSIWEPYVRLVCERHGFRCTRLSPGFPGTYPTFLVKLQPRDGARSTPRSIVVKFFGSPFGGTASFHIERDMSCFLARHSMPLHSPAVLQEGELTAGWSYLIFEAIPAVRIGQVRQHLSRGTWEIVARQMGGFIQAFHAVVDPASTPLLASENGWEGFKAFLHRQAADCITNHARWNDLPSHLLEQLPGFLLPLEQLLDLSSTPHLIHADLTADHLLGRLIPPSLSGSFGSPLSSSGTSNWESLAIIDWGDTQVGNILYELVALHLDLFQADKHLLRLCLEAYHLPDFYRSDFARKALSMVLLHQFPMPHRVYAPHQNARTLSELADRLFSM